MPAANVADWVVSLATLLASPLGNSAWPLRYYCRDRLFSVAARHHWVEPDFYSPLRKLRFLSQAWVHEPVLRIGF
jgi:hypothetical protein